MKPVLSRIQSHAAIVTGALLLLLVEEFFLSQSFQPAALTASPNGSGWYALFGEMGNFIKAILVFVALATILTLERLPSYWREAVQQVRPRRAAVFTAANLVCFAALYFVTWFIFTVGPDTALPPRVLVTWLALVMGTLISWFFIIADTAFYRCLLRRELRTVVIALAGALLVSVIALYTRNLWGPLGDLAFTLTLQLLSALSSAPLIADHTEKIIGLGDFFVRIDADCSGYEGIGLVTTFVGIYIYTFRRTLKFPNVLWLIPLGIVVVWSLNVFRIAALIMIGHMWSEDIAIGGFHSQAGWIAFIVTSGLVISLSHSSRYFQRNARTGNSPPSDPGDQAVATLIPLVTLLASILLTQAFSAGFDWLYPLRVVAAGAALAFAWPALHLKFNRIAFGPVPLTAGAGCALLWIVLLETDASVNAAFAGSLMSVPPVWAAAWLIVRLAGAVITVPLAEELAFRGYLLCRLSRLPISLTGPLPASIAAIALSSLAFGALHGAWLAGTLAGLLFAAVRLHCKSLSSAIVAHGVANLLIGVYAAFTGSWNLM